MGMAKRPDRILKNYRLVETNDRWLAITEFDTKVKLNKFVKTIIEQRKAVISDLTLDKLILSEAARGNF